MSRLSVISVLAAVAMLAPSCKEPAEMQVSAPKITIHARVPDNATKVALTPSGNGLHLAWEAGDALRVISGSQSSQFTIQEGFTAHDASFSGSAVSGTSFDILYPGTFASVAEAEASDFSYQVQDGNGSTSHLRYAALLSGVDEYTDIEFTESWATAHGGTIKRAGAIRLVLTLPEGVTTVTGVNVDLAGRKLALDLQNVDVSQSGQILTAYLMTPWNDIELPVDSKVEIVISAPDDMSYGITFNMNQATTLRAGRVSIFNVPNYIVEYPFAGGDGTQANPYLIANARHLQNMSTMYNTAADDAEFKYWFRMTKDVDASSISNWEPLNYRGSTWLKAIDFDGAGHVISNLKSNGYTYGSFAGVLFGDVHDVTFSNATITNGKSWTGVVGAFLGSGTNYSRPASCTNVTITGSTVTGAKNAGGIAGHIQTKGSISGCSVVNTSVSGPGYVGGFAAQADISGEDKYEVPVIFTDCIVDGVTVSNTAATAGALFTGGFIGYTYSAVSFIDCQVKNTTVTAAGAAIQNIGGFVGGTDYAGANFQNCSVTSDCTVSANGSRAGGFVGYAFVPDAYKDCWSAAKVTSTNEYVGAFVGFAAGASTYTGCHASGNASGTKHVGGFAGIAENASFLDCYYENGTISASGTDKNTQSGGFCGYVTNGVSFQGCYVSGATITTSGQRIGGFIGQYGSSYTASNNVSLSQCHVENTAVTGSTNTGGFVGVQYDNISRSYVQGGSVTAKGAHCGGFSAFSQQGSITNCYTTASVIGGSYAQVGGCIGILYNSPVSYCYAAGSVSGSGTDVAAFVGQCALQGSPGSIDCCIGWHPSLPFFGSNPADASMTNYYSGNSESVSAQAGYQNWPTTTWNLSGTMPLLVDSPRRIPAIFVGDSITWQWARNSGTYDQSRYPILIPFNSAYMTQNGNNITVKFHPAFFSGHGYLDKGISGQNTTQMLSRFNKDVIALDPEVVVIMAGTNDLAQGVSKEDIVANIAAMAEMAESAGIKVVLCTVTPCNDKYSKLSNPNTKGAHIITLNGMLKSYADSKGFTWCDYWTHLVADDGLAMNSIYWLYDHLHPGPDGYDVMESVIQPILESLIY